MAEEIYRTENAILRSLFFMLFRQKWSFDFEDKFVSGIVYMQLLGYDKDICWEDKNLKCNSIIVFVRNNKFYKINRHDLLMTVELNYKTILQNAKKLNVSERASYKKYFYRLRKEKNPDLQAMALSERLTPNWEFFERIVSDFQINSNDFIGKISFDEYLKTGDLNCFSNDALVRIIDFYSNKFSYALEGRKEVSKNDR